MQAQRAARWIPRPPPVPAPVPAPAAPPRRESGLRAAHAARPGRWPWWWWWWWWASARLWQSARVASLCLPAIGVSDTAWGPVAACLAGANRRGGVSGQPVSRLCRRGLKSPHLVSQRRHKTRVLCPDCRWGLFFLLGCLGRWGFFCLGCGVWVGCFCKSWRN